MNKISGSTFYIKKLFPFIWFGFLTFFLVIALFSGALEQSIMVVIVPIFMAFFGFFLFKKLFWILADEVYDEGDSLLVRKGDKEQRVWLKDIINVSYSHLQSPERIVLQSRTDGAIGKELAFIAPVRLKLFSKNPMVVELISRIDQAKNAQ